MRREGRGRHEPENVLVRAARQNEQALVEAPSTDRSDDVGRRRPVRVAQFHAEHHATATDLAGDRQLLDRGHHPLPE